MMTAGIELEWADVDRRAEIPPDLGRWNEKDYTIVNSDGRANHPTGAEWAFGGEINTVPTETAPEQADITRALAVLLRPTINYRCNLHVHVRPAVDIRQDVEALKALARYIRNAEAFVYAVVEPVPLPQWADYQAGDAWAGAMKRYRRRLVSHHYRLPETRYAELMTATTPEEFVAAHAPKTKTGRRNFAIAPRPGINLRSLWKHGTIEYRHFPGTADPVEVESCVAWALMFTEAALANAPSVDRLYESRAWHFPEFRPYDHQLELGYLATAYRTASTRAVRVHGEHQPVSGSDAPGEPDAGVGDPQRGFEWEGE